MKKFYQNLNLLWKTVFLEGVIGIIAMLISIVGVVLGKPGWLIGIAIGTLISIVSTISTSYCSQWALKDSKPGLFILGFLARMILMAGGLVLTVLMQFVAKVHVFDFSVWGLLIGFTPSLLITIIVQMKYNKTGDAK